MILNLGGSHPKLIKKFIINGTNVTPLHQIMDIKVGINGFSESSKKVLDPSGKVPHKASNLTM
jgi:hypothetical protein